MRWITNGEIVLRGDRFTLYTKKTYNKTPFLYWERNSDGLFIPFYNLKESKWPEGTKKEVQLWEILNEML